MAKKKKARPVKKLKGKAEKSSVTADEVFNYLELKFVRLLEMAAKLEIKNSKIPNLVTTSIPEIMVGPSSDGLALNVHVGVLVEGRPQEAKEGDDEQSQLLLNIKYQCGFAIAGAKEEAIKPHADVIAKHAMLIMWPQIREVVQSTTGRMSIPPVVLPMLMRNGLGGREGKHLILPD